MGVEGGSGINQYALEQKKMQDALAAQKKATDEAQRQFQEQQQLRGIESARGPGYIGLETNKYERQAGVTNPGYEGFRDRTTGELIDAYKIDPFKGEMSQRLRQEALSTGPSEWAKNALQQQQYEQAQGLGRVGLEQQKAQAAAQAQLMRQGGLGGGARTSLARSGMRDALMANQGVYAQGSQRRFGINDTDLQRRQELTGIMADAERQAQLQNIGTLKEDVNRRGTFDQNRYAEQMKAWAAEKQAAAQRNAGGGGCFPEWTEIKMRDGRIKKISEISIGDELFVGGKVTNKIVLDGEFILHDYMGVDVTASHAVLEGMAWVRVGESRRGIKTTKVVDTVFNLDTESHQIWIDGVMFADYVETDDKGVVTNDDSLRALNGARA